MSNDRWWPSELLSKTKKITEMKVPYRSVGNPVKVECMQAMCHGKADDIFVILTDKDKRIVFHVTRNKDPDAKEFDIKMMCENHQKYSLKGVEDGNNFIMTNQEKTCKVVASL